MEGFLRSIALSPGNSLQDTLRLLTLWFTYGYQHGVNQAIAQGMATVNIDVWLEVIPQIIARIQTARQTIQQLIVRLLHDIGRAHPQALIYPLTVASKSNVASRKAVAQGIMAKMREHAATIVDQVGSLVSGRVTDIRRSSSVQNSFALPFCGTSSGTRVSRRRPSTTSRITTRRPCSRFLSRYTT